MAELKQTIEQSFEQYAGMVIQSRALVDVRDGLKPSARQIFYSMLQHKLTHKNPYKKTANAVGMAMADYYIHGDSSCEGIIMRAGQSFAMRYPLVEVKGNAGTLIESGNYAAMRYTESRLSELSDILFEDIDKETITDWRDNYDNTKQYPSVLPTKGFYNIVNGTSGISVGMASSVPQYNLKEVNNALITLIDNPNCSFEDIYCAPDFATGGILYNENEVKQSMEKGTGFACKLRSVVNFDDKERCFTITEIPYGVYTNTICGQLEEIINKEEGNPGIERFNDLTGKTPLIKIYLSKKANPDRVLKYLYKETSLQYYYAINFTMLENGRFPKVFTWKELLQAHIDHEKEVYRRGFEFDLNKIKSRLHIIEGLLKAYDVIDEVIQTIKTAADTKSANLALQKLLQIDEVQAKAILDLKLSKLSKLDIGKLKSEQEELMHRADEILEILNDNELFNEQLKRGWREVAQKFGDARRTKIIKLAEGDDSEPIERKQLSLSFTNNAAVYVSEVSSLYTQKRNGTGTKFKLNDREYVIDNVIGENTDTILFFTTHGNFYHLKMGNFVINEKQYLSNFISLYPDEHIVAAAIVEKNNTLPYIIFVTKNGIIKKSEMTEYNLKRNSGAAAIKLDPNDEITSVIFTKDDNIGILTYNGNFIITTTSDIRPIGRVAKGIKGIKLNDGDFVISAKLIPTSTQTLISVSQDGYIKQTLIKEFSTQGKNTKGAKIQSLNENDKMADFYPLQSESDVLIAATSSCIKISTREIPTLTKNTLGVKSIKLSPKNYVIRIS